MNDVKLLGYLGKDFEAEYTQGGKCYAKNSLAITKKWKNERGNEESKTTWIPIELNGKSAETQTRSAPSLSLRAASDAPFRLKKHPTACASPPTSHTPPCTMRAAKAP